MRILGDQPQMHFTKDEPVVVKPDKGVSGKQIGDGYEYRQGDDYMIVSGLQEAFCLARMGYDVQLQE